MSARTPSLVAAIDRLKQSGFKPTPGSATNEIFATCFRCHGVGKLRVIGAPESPSGLDLWCEVCKRLPASDIPTAIAANAMEEARQSYAPILDVRALHGVLGEYVNICAPHTEVAIPAILITAIVSLGALIGRGPKWHFGDSDHHTNLFGLLVGNSGSGRKGGAISVGARKLLKLVDEDFLKRCVTSGLSSAEGLIEMIRDATPERTDERGRVVPSDEGVHDKRLLMIEGEFVSVLEAISREGNRASAVLRDLWDSLDVRTLVKKNPQSASGAHFSFIGAITPVELTRRLGAMSIGNGLANRFLLVWSTRSQLLPEDSVPDPEALRLVGRRITNAVDRARRIGHISWSDDARIVWASEYAKLAVSDTPDPRLRALFERAAPMVRRIAMIFALLDGTGTVGVVHLDAALAVWRYSADSWRMVFAEEDPRSPLARKLEAFIRDAGEVGLSRTQLRKLVGSNDVPADSINAALLELSRAGQAQVEKVRTRGRSCEIWRHARYVGAVRAQVAIEAPEEEWEEREQSAEVSPVKVLNPAFLPLLPSIQPEPLFGR